MNFRTIEIGMLDVMDKVNFCYFNLETSYIVYIQMLLTKQLLTRARASNRTIWSNCTTLLSRDSNRQW